MSYRVEYGSVVLTMTQEDYTNLLMLLGESTAHALMHPSTGSPFFTKEKILAFMNRLNEGNPHYTPYQVEDRKNG